MKENPTSKNIVSDENNEENKGLNNTTNICKSDDLSLSDCRPSEDGNAERQNYFDEFQTLTEVGKHIEFNAYIPSYECKICNKIEKEIEKMFFHVSNHLKIILYKCHLCLRTCTHWKYFEGHLNTHGLTRDTQKKNKFELLDLQSFGTLKSGTKQYDSYRKYKDSDSDIKSQPCTDLNFHKLLGFDEITMKDTNKTIEGAEERVVTVDEAERLCKEHFILESFKRPVQYQCKLCGYRNNFGKARIIKHVMAHLKLYPYVCPICDDKFIQDSNFERHLNCHGVTMHEHKHEKFSVINPQIYDLQGELKKRLYDNKSNLCSNKKISDSDVKISCKKKVDTSEYYDRLVDLSYQCKSCLKVCATAKLMKRHILDTHNQEFPYKCECCQESFSTPGYLKIHQKTHEKSSFVKTKKGACLIPKTVDLGTGVKLNEERSKAEKCASDKDCGYCGIKAESETQLQIHMKENHPLENTFLNLTETGDFEPDCEGLNIRLENETNMDSKQNDNSCKLMSTSQINTEIEKLESPPGFDLLGNEKFESNENFVMLENFPELAHNQGERMLDFSVEQIGNRKHKKVFLENASEPLFFGTKNKLDKVLGGVLYSQEQAEQLLLVSCIKIQDTKEYECTVCRGNFRVKSKQLMKNHVFNHYDVYTHQCEHCKDMFRSENQYKTHLLAHKRKKGKKEKCTTIASETVFKTGNNYAVSREEYVDTRTEIDEEDILSVDIEKLKGKKVSTQQGKTLMKSHLYKDTKSDLFCCKLCDYQRPNASQIHNHILSYHYNVHMYVCPHKDCNMKLLNWGRYTTHEKTHLRLQEKAQVEENEVLNEEYLLLKQPVYLGKEAGKKVAGMYFSFDDTNKKYKCKLCEYTSRHQRVEQHILAAHLPMVNLFQCEICGKNVRYSEARFKEHVAQHYQETQQCSKCHEIGIYQNQSYSKISLEAHIRKYHTSGKFICEFKDCNEQFNTRAKLNKHDMTNHKKGIS